MSGLRIGIKDSSVIWLSPYAVELRIYWDHGMRRVGVGANADQQKRGGWVDDPGFGETRVVGHTSLQFASWRGTATCPSFHF